MPGEEVLEYIAWAKYEAMLAVRAREVDRGR